MFSSFKRISNIKRKDMSLKRIFSAIIRRILNIPHLIYFYLPFGFPKKNRRKLSYFRNIHKGKRCFVIANGPSLKQIDFNLLKDEYTIGMNRIYLMKEQNGFTPTYLACIDVKSQILQFHEELDQVSIPCFFNFNLRNKFRKSENQNFILDKLNPAFATDISKAYGSGKSVTYIAIQLAFLMGFSEVYLIGKDHSYNTNATAGKGIKSDGNEDNHFIKGYYKPGQNWDAPDYLSEEFAYKLAKTKFENNNKIIKDATIGGKLEVFEKVDFYSLFPNKQ